MSESLQPPPLRPASLVEAGREGKEEVAERSPRLCKEPVWGEEKVLRKGVSPETWEVLLSPEGLPVLGLLEWDGGGALPALRVCVWRGQQGSPLPQCLSSGGPPRSGWLSRGQLWLVQSLSLPRVSPSSMSPCWNDLKSGVPLGPHFLPEASGDVTVAQPGPLPPRGRGLSPVHPTPAHLHLPALEEPRCAGRVCGILHRRGAAVLPLPSPETWSGSTKTRGAWRMRTLCGPVGLRGDALWDLHQRGKMPPSTFSSRMVSTRLRCRGEGLEPGVREAGGAPSPPLPGLVVTSWRSRGSGIRVGFSCGGKNSSRRMAARADFCRWMRSEISSACGPRVDGGRCF